MSKIAGKLTDLIGNTPLLELTEYNLKKEVKGKLIAKLEYFNPTGSVHDRIGLAMLDDAEKKGIINRETVIIEPTSGSTGKALVFVATSKKYRIILTMPETISEERCSLFKALGAELVLTPGQEGMNGAIRKAEELAEQFPNSFIPQQFENSSYPEIQRKTTAEEIWNDLDGKVDIIVGRASTGGTITGIGEALKKKNPDIKVIAVELSDCPVLSYGAASHNIQFFSDIVVPKVLNMEIIDEIYKVNSEEAFRASRDLARNEGLLIGISSGSAVFAATEIAKRQENIDKNIVVLLPDTGEKYLATSLFQQAERL